MSSGENCMNEQYIDFLAEELAREKLVIFVGAGVSRNSGLPSWQQLVEVFAKKLGINKSCFSPEETLQIPQIFYNEFSKIKYYEILEEVFEGIYEPNSIHKTLKKMNISHIITTNYDELIEKELNESKEYDIIGKDEELAYSKSTKMIIKMHGDMKYRNIVLKQEDYISYEKNFPLISTYVKSLFTTNTIMFIGYSLNDVNVKNIMEWISNILNEDFRKVYLVTFDEKENNNILIRKKHENDKLVNRISLSVVNNNYEESLNNFLEDIINKRNEKKEEKNRKFFKELNFLDKDKLEKLLKCEINLLPEYYDDGFIKEQELQIDIEENKLEEKLKDYKENLIKSKIKKINGKYLNEIFKDKKDIIDIEELQGEENKNDEILKSIITYDKEKFLQLVEENSNLKNKWLLVFGYNFFQEYDKAVELLENLIKNYKEKSVEKLIWNHYLYTVSKNEGEYEFDLFQKNLQELKNICKRYLKYNENISSEKQMILIQEAIYNNYIKNSFESFKLYLEKIREKKNTVYHIGNPIKEPLTLIKEKINYLIFNGIFLKGYEIREFFKLYLEIIFTPNKNNIKIEEGNQIKNLINQLKYFDVFILLNIMIDNLEIFLEEYEIKNIELKDSNKKILFDVLNNILKLDKTNFRERENILKNLLIILEKTKLDKTYILEFIEIIFKERRDILYEGNIFYKDILSLINLILYKNIDLITLEDFKDILEEIFKTQRDNKISKRIFKFICYQGYKKGIRNLEQTDELKFFLEKASNIERISLFKLLDNELQTNEKNIILKNLNENFDTVEYIKLIEEQIIQSDYKYEDKVLEALNGIACQKYSFSTTLEVLIDNILALFLNNFVTDEFKQKLKELNNENFKYYIEVRDYKDILEYALNKENFDLNNFQEKDLRFFTKIGIKELLKKGKEYQDFMKMISSYSKENNDRISETYIEFLEEQLTTKGDQ